MNAHILQMNSRDFDFGGYLANTEPLSMANSTYIRTKGLQGEVIKHCRNIKMRGKFTFGDPAGTNASRGGEERRHERRSRRAVHGHQRLQAGAAHLQRRPPRTVT